MNQIIGQTTTEYRRGWTGSHAAPPLLTGSTVLAVSPYQRHVEPPVMLRVEFREIVLSLQRPVAVGLVMRISLQVLQGLVSLVVRRSPLQFLSRSVWAT